MVISTVAALMTLASSALACSTCEDNSPPPGTTGESHVSATGLVITVRGREKVHTAEASYGTPSGPQYYYSFNLACEANIDNRDNVACGAAVYTCLDPDDNRYYVFRGTDPSHLPLVPGLTVCLGPRDLVAVADIRADVGPVLQGLIPAGNPALTVEPRGAAIVHFPAIVSATTAGPTQTFTSTLAIDGASITATLTPTYSWDFGDGTTAVTSDPQRAYDGTLPSQAPAGYYLTHEYTDATDGRTVTLTVTWTPTYTIFGVAGTFTDQPITTTSATTFPVRSAEGQLING